ncbi:HupE/UreJ family protein [Mucisphaera calidilacus]|uniref:HupE / UreJ protein n=1 Tax=Mucisphaera calidilacus TaxID=2527982 RepID=A0A518BYH7_9BACT|nr:HupE/UreJ family protein [Mucisphaera calidilacus]QDU72027.1 hypothetical protein Pan265_18870 [Mucisphaera calidilacus]
MRRRVRLMTLAGVVGLGGAEAQAHLVSTELGPFYDGVAHVVVTATDLMMLLAMALLAALAGVTAARRASLTLIAGWALGLVGGFLLPGSSADLLVLPMAAWVGVMLFMGVLVAGDVRAPAVLLAVAGGVLGLLGGLSNGQAAQADGVALTVLGIGVGVGVLSLMLSGLGVWLEVQGMRILIRIAGSWVAAISLLILGWQFRPSA